MINHLVRTIILASASCVASGVIAARNEAYDPEKAVNYIRLWVASPEQGKPPLLLRNPAYPDLSAGSAGGDCTNFMSQGMRAGGWSNTATTSKTADTLWWFKSKVNAEYSQTWSVANAFFRHLNGGINPPYPGKSYEGWTRFDGVSSVNYGDIIAGDLHGMNLINHNMMVTGFKLKSDGILEPRVSYHSTDTKDRPWSEFMAIVKSNYPKAKFYRFTPFNVCMIPKPKYIF